MLNILLIVSIPIKSKITYWNLIDFGNNAILGISISLHKFLFT